MIMGKVVKLCHFCPEHKKMPADGGTSKGGRPICKKCKDFYALLERQYGEGFDKLGEKKS